MQPIKRPSIGETAWISQAQKGDAEAFTALVEAYQQPVYNFCRRMLGDSDAAEDAAQETFLRVYQHLAAYDPRRPFGTWLLAIAAHHCIDRLRRQRAIHFSLDGEETQDARYPDLQAVDPEEETARRLTCERLYRLLPSLDPLQRAILVLRYWQHAPESEIACALHLSVPAVRSRLHRARRALAHLWAREYIIPCMGIGAHGSEVF